MAKHYKMNKRKSRKLFTRTASRVHKKNTRKIQRGGTRL